MRFAITIALVTAFARAATPPTFTHDIAPIIYEKCAPCHHPGDAAPFSLLTYADVKKRAPQIAAATSSRFMPPFLPEHGYGDFADDRSLTTDQIAIIEAWVRDGAPEGPVADIPAPPSFTADWQLGKPDLILQAATVVRVACVRPRYLLELHPHSQSRRPPLGSRHRDSPRPPASGASRQLAGRSQWLCGTSGKCTGQGVSRDGPRHHP